jgi:hypothetical protein
MYRDLIVMDLGDVLVAVLVLGLWVGLVEPRRDA